MTDEQIMQFVLYRAEQAGRLVKLSNPKLVLCRNGNSIFLAVRFNGWKDAFLVRFTNNLRRGMFKVKPQDAMFDAWKAQFIKDGISETGYDLSSLPASVKHFVSYAIVDALKTKGMGFDLFSISFSDDLEIIRPDESYEEAAIETDLLCFASEEVNEILDF